MSQEPTFTAEQLLAEANMHGDHVADMLVYAATLRQAARVDEGMACRLYNSGYAAGHHHTVEGGFVDVLPVDFDSYHADEVREILSEVALSAQPAERQGDAVAKVRHFEYRGIARNGFSQEAEMLYGAPIVPDGTLLYLHPAAPVGVPDGMVAIGRVEMARTKQHCVLSVPVCSNAILYTRRESVPSIPASPTPDKEGCDER
jgi:hypothetical protein